MVATVTLTLWPAEEVAVQAHDIADLDALNRYAFLYTSTDKGNATGIRFMATTEDAQKWCESDLSCGVMHGSRWAYFWTAVGTYLVNREGWIPGRGLPNLTLPLVLEADNGQWDERIESTGCRMIRLPEIERVLRPLGVDVAYKGRRQLEAEAA